MPTRWRMPPESCFGYALRKSDSPVRRSASSTTARRSPGERPECASGNSTFASTVHHGSSAKSWNTKVSGLRLSAGGAPRSSAAPLLGCSSPPRIESSVLLPQPEGPTIATTSPARTVKETSSRTSSVPKRWLIWSAIRSIRYSDALSVQSSLRGAKRRSNPAFLSRQSKLDCFASLAMTVVAASCSIRLHIFLRDNGIDRKPLVDKALLLQPFDLVADILHVELAVGIDIGAVAHHLLDRQVGIFGDDLEQRLCLIVDLSLAILHRRQDHVMIFAVGALQRSQQLGHQRLVGQRLRRGEDRSELPRRLVADPAQKFRAVGLHQRARGRDRQERSIDGLALQRGRRIRQRLQRQHFHVGQLELVSVGK